MEPAAVGMHAAMLADVKPGKKIIILGAGCIGLMTLQACKCLGATEIAVVDVLEKRLTMAEQLGATVVINGGKEDTIARCQQFTEDMGADIVFETAGSAVTVKQAPYLVMRGGKNYDCWYCTRRFGNQFPQNQSRSHYPDGIPLCQSLSGHD